MERIYTLDLHTHLNEKKVKPEDYWQRAQAVGLDVIAITEHADKDPQSAYEKLIEGKPENMVLIPGSELNSEHGHLLCYGKDKRFYSHEELFKFNAPLETILDIVEKNGYLASISHPWGFDYDSFGFTLGFEKIEELVATKKIGVETYNGMIGNLSNFIFDTNWVVRPINFFDFLEKNRVTRKTGITRLTGKIKSKIDNKRRDLVERCARAIDLGEKAAFVTAGSDGHYAKRIGEGILKIKSSETQLDNQNVLKLIQEKENVIWYGPLVIEEEPGIFRRADTPFDNKEILQGIRYASESVLGKVKKKILKKI